MFHSLKSINKNQKGFTLIELIVAIAITVVIIGGVVMAIFHVFDVNALSSNHMKAVRQVQNAGYWVGRDVQMAKRVEPTADADGFPLEVAWQEWGTTDSNDATSHEVTYTLDGSDFKRSHSIDGGEPSEIVVAQYIDSITVAPIPFAVGDNLTLTVTATTATWPQLASETRVYEIIPRPE